VAGELYQAGVEERIFSKLTAALVVGGTKFKADVRRRILKSAGGRTDERRWRRMLPFSEVIRVVSEVKGEPWDDFKNRYGDCGRDLAVYVARQRCGLTLREIGEHIGMKDKTVSFACSSIRKLMEHDNDLIAAYLAVLVKLGEDEI